jgi:MFS family permease
LIVWSAWLVLMAGANLATPLYAVYAKEFGFSSLVLTSVFATYAFVLAPALILFGRLSDRFGRRPIIFSGLSVSAGGLLLFVFSTSPAWLYAARALQGLAVGMISGAATAALVELDPEGDRRRPAMFAGLAQAGGSATGPSYIADLLHTENLALLAAISALALIASFATQIVSERWCPPLHTMQAIGLAVLAGGLALLVAAAPLGSLPFLIVGALAAGVGHGLAFLNAQEELNEIAPEERRGEVTAAFICCIYLLVASSVIATGLLDLTFSLTVSVCAVSGALIAGTVPTAIWQRRY